MLVKSKVDEPAWLVATAAQFTMFDEASIAFAAATDLREDDLLECLNALLGRVTFDPFTFKERVR